MFEKYYKELIGYFSRLLNDKDHAYDIVHECYSRVLALPPKTPIRVPRAFLYRTARNIVANEYRKNSRRQHTDLNGIQLIDASSKQPLERLESQERVDQLMRAIDSLPPRGKEAFLLYKFEGLSQRQIAQKMGISKNMVERHVMNAMKVCTQCLKKINE